MAPSSGQYAGDAVQPSGRHPAWQNALRPKGKPGPLLTLTSAGKALYTILLPARPTTQDQKAAADLAHWLKVMTGAVFPVYNEGVKSGDKNTTSPFALAGAKRSGGAWRTAATINCQSDLGRWCSGGSRCRFGVENRTGLKCPIILAPVISIGRTSIWQALPGRRERDVDLGNEGYAIAVCQANLILWGGRMRGPINAVYALLEEDLGCRWFDERSASIPRIRTLRFRPVPRRFIPVLDLRDPYYWDAWDGTWSLHNRTNAVEAQIPEAWGGHPRVPGPMVRDVGYLQHGGSWFVHTFTHCVPPERYFKKHPEYYSEIKGERVPGQLCLTNPEVLSITIGNVRRAIRGTPGCRVISVSPNDAAPLCECAKCRAVERAEGAKSGVLLRFVNAVADVVRKELPGVRVSTLAYESTSMPPKKTRPRDNVIIVLCTDSHAWAWPFLPVTASQKFQKALRGWEAIGAYVHVWDYTVNFSHEAMPTPNLPVVRNNLRFFIRHGVQGVMMEGADQSYGGENAKLRCWVWGKQLWNVSWDTLPLMRDFIFGYYGAAAAPICKYNLVLLKIWQRLSAAPGMSGFKNSAIYHIRFSPNAPFLSAAFLRRAFRIFAQAERLARDPETRRRVQLAKLPIIYTRLCQDLGFVVSAFGGLMLPGRRLKRLARGSVDRENYRHLVEEAAAIVRRERIERFVGGFPWRFTGPTQAQQNLKLWRAMAAPVPRLEALEMSPEWRFRMDPASDSCSNAFDYPLSGWNARTKSPDMTKRQPWAVPDFDDSAWPTVCLLWNVSVGCDFPGWETAQHQDKTYPAYRGEGWFRQWLDIPRGFLRRKHLFLVFLGVAQEAAVWLDGKLLGMHTCKSTGLNDTAIKRHPFAFDVPAALRKEGRHLLAVRVTKRSGILGGIWRPVWLVSADKPRSKLSPLLESLLAAKQGVRRKR